MRWTESLLWTDTSVFRACAKITSHFRIPSSGHLCPILNRKILEIVLLFLWFCNFGSNKSDLNPGANAVNLFLRKPLAGKMNKEAYHV